MRKLLTMGSVDLAPVHAVSGVTLRLAVLTVGRGRVWVTQEGCATDHWLGAGQTLLLAPARLAVIEADRNGATYALSQRDPGPARRDWRAELKFFCRPRRVGVPKTGFGTLRARLYLSVAFSGAVLAAGCEVQRHSHANGAPVVATRGAEQTGMAAVFVTARRMTTAEKHAYDAAHLVSQAPGAPEP